MIECEFVHLCVRRREWEVFGLFSSEYNGVLLSLSKKFIHLFWNKPAEFFQRCDSHCMERANFAALHDEFLCC